MRVLILTGKFGMGHVAAAEAVAEKLQMQYPDMEVDMVDLMERVYPLLSKYIYIGFNAMVNKMPHMYNKIICLDCQMSHIMRKEPPADPHIVGGLVKKYHPDAIISTWLIGSKYIEAFKKKYDPGIPFITCVTDITPFDDWISKSTDAYIVGSEYTKTCLVRKGVNPDIVHIGGIPVRTGFGKHCRPAAEQVRELLIMGGGLGFMPDTQKILDFVAAMPGIHTTIITGKNKKLCRTLRAQYADSSRSIEVLGYTDDVPGYMDSADVIITKPGGITLFEAIESELPMFVVKPYFEQEKTNAAFIEREGIGKVLWKGQHDLQGELERFLSDRAGRQRIKERMHAIKGTLHSEEIVGVLDSLMDGDAADIAMEG